MVLLREVLGEALRHHRSAQRRTLREVSAEANVSLGYLSEIERGHKEPSSELLAAVCAALELQLSQLLAEVSTSVLRSEGASAPSDGAPSESREHQGVPDEQMTEASVNLFGPSVLESDEVASTEDEFATSRPEFTACLPTTLAQARSRRSLPHAAPAVEVAA